MGPRLHQWSEPAISAQADILMGVIHENVSDSALREHWADPAYVRGACGRELTTAAANIDPAGDQDTGRTR